MPMEKPVFVYHILEREIWEAAVALLIKAYFPKNFEIEGRFVHCALEEQIAGVLGLFYRGVQGLVALKIETSLMDNLVMENSSDNRLPGIFPHIRGPLITEYVVEVLDLSPNADGLFTFPPIATSE